MEAAQQLHDQIQNNPPKTPIEYILAFCTLIFAGVGTFMKTINTTAAEYMQTAEFFMYIMSGIVGVIAVFKFILSLLTKKKNG